MRFKYLAVMAVWNAVLLVGHAEGQTSLQLSFASTPVVGQPVAFQWQVVGDWRQHTSCQNFYVHYSASVDWGDGSTRGHWGEDGSSGMDHIYLAPGRYRVKATAVWWISGNPGTPACEQTAGTQEAAIWVDVLPNSSIANGWIGTFFDQQATICSTPVSPGSPARVYVVAEISDPAASVAGAEFRLVNSHPGSFSVSVTTLPGWIMIGNAFGDGVSIGGNCSSGLNRVAMLELTVYSIDGTTDGHIFVHPHLSPPNPNVPGPLTIFQCDAPIYTAIGAGRSYSALLHSTEGTTTYCPSSSVAVARRTWGQVKGLFR